MKRNMELAKLGHIRDPVVPLPMTKLTDGFIYIFNWNEILSYVKIDLHIKMLHLRAVESLSLVSLHLIFFNDCLTFALILTKSFHEKSTSL